MGVRAGLIGAGTMGRRHLQALSQDHRVELVGVADAVAEAATTAAASVGAQPCPDLAALAALGIDAVFVTLPNVYHGPVVLDALTRGLHVFDMIAWLIGPIESVAALGRQSCYPDYDDVALLLRCAGDRPVAFSTCGHATWAPPQERVELYGDHALLISEDMDHARYTTRENPRAGWQQFSSPDMVSLWGYVDEDRAFIDACLGVAPPPVTVDDAFHSLAVLDAAYASIAAGGLPTRVRTE